MSNGHNIWLMEFGTQPESETFGADCRECGGWVPDKYIIIGRVPDLPQTLDFYCKSCANKLHILDIDYKTLRPKIFKRKEDIDPLRPVIYEILLTEEQLKWLRAKLPEWADQLFTEQEILKWQAEFSLLQSTP